MTVAPEIAHAAGAVFRERWSGLAAADREDPLERYRLDPCALADDGHAKVQDLVTLQEVPFQLWDHQREVLRSWIDCDHLAATGEVRFRNVHEEKSRQMGLTWLVVYALTWVLNLHAVPGLALSLKLREVCDSGFTLDSIFGRVRFMHERLPERLRAPLQFVGGNDAAIRNPLRPGAFLAGRGASLDPGRGGRYGYVFLDEAARIPWGRSVHASVSRACPVGRFYNSTPRGEDDLYFWLREQRPAGYTFLRHHWSLHPVYSRGLHVAGEDASCPLCERTQAGEAWDAQTRTSHRYPGRLTSPWYEDVISELSDEAVAQELDIDYAGSLPARVYPEFNDEIHCREDIPYDPMLPIMLSFDYGWQMTAVGIWQRTPAEMRKIGEYEASDQVPEAVCDGIRRTLVGLGVEPRNLAHFNTLTWLCVGDPAGDAHNMATGRPLTADYRAAGFNIVSRRFSIDQTIVATKRLMLGKPLRMLVSRKGAPRSIAHFKNNRWPTDRSGNRKLYEREPLNDIHNHACRADAYLITYLFPPPETQRAPQVDPLDTVTGRLDEDLPDYDSVF